MGTGIVALTDMDTPMHGVVGIHVQESCRMGLGYVYRVHAG